MALILMRLFVVATICLVLLINIIGVGSTVESVSHSRRTKNEIAEYLDEAARMRRMPEIRKETSEEVKAQLVKAVSELIRHWIREEFDFLTLRDDSPEGKPRWNWEDRLKGLQPYTPEESEGLKHSTYWRHVLKSRYRTPTEFLNSAQQMALLLALTDDMKLMAEALTQLNYRVPRDQRLVALDQAAEVTILADITDVMLRTRMWLIDDMAPSNALDVATPKMKRMFLEYSAPHELDRPTYFEVSQITHALYLTIYQMPKIPVFTRKKTEK